MTSDGKITAQIGYASEGFIHYATETYWKARDEGQSDEVARDLLREAIVNTAIISESNSIVKLNNIIDPVDYVIVQNDSLVLANTIVDQLLTMGVKKVESIHSTGTDKKAVVNLTGGNSPADLLYKIKTDKEVRWQGFSLKYSKYDSKVQKVYAPTLNTFLPIVDNFYKDIVGKSSNIFNDCQEQADKLHQTFLDILKDHPNRKEDGRISHDDFRLLRKNKDPLFFAMESSTLDVKYNMVKIIKSVLEQILEKSDKLSLKHFVMMLMNIPKDMIPTLNVAGYTTKNGLDISVLDMKETIEKMIDKQSLSLTTNKEDATRMYIGPISMYLDVRPGFSRSIMSRSMNIYLHEQKLNV